MNEGYTHNLENQWRKPYCQRGNQQNTDDIENETRSNHLWNTDVT